MTRINLVNPRELTDQHLFAEFREIKMIPKSLARSIAARGFVGALRLAGADFTLNKGHVSFFYDKGLYLHERYVLLKWELQMRGVNYNTESEFDPDGVMTNDECWNNWEPEPKDYELIRERIAERIAQKPQWYRYMGVPLPESDRWSMLKHN